MLNETRYVYVYRAMSAAPPRIYIRTTERQLHNQIRMRDNQMLPCN